MTSPEYQEPLKQHLQSATPSKLEHPAATLVGRLLDVPIAVAKSGFQHGADAGPAGQHGRRFRLECKRYSDASSLSERELLGELDQALLRDEALEAWLLVATCVVPEQIHQSLDLHGERHGVPVVIIGWADDEIAPLAALCASDPDLVDAELSKEAGTAARHLRRISGDAIHRLRRNLEPWSLGFESVRASSHEKLARIWNSACEAYAALGQNAAGGAQANRIRRNAVYDALNRWWHAPPNIAPAAVIGLDGVGKTWATLDWLIDNKDQQPILLTIPSSATGVVESQHEAGVKRLLAEALYDMTGVRTLDHWIRRLDRLLQRPADEGPVLTVFFDGLNQNPSVPWLRRLQILHGKPFARLVRVIVSTRSHYFEDRLSSLRRLFAPAVQITVDRYDTEPGGELDRMLSLEGIRRVDLNVSVLELARTPRLFNLVLRYSDSLAESDQVTVHRILWEYGRDTLGVQDHKSFSPDEWDDWLKEIAKKCRAGLTSFSRRSLGETVHGPALSADDVYARLSEVIDGPLFTATATGHLQPKPLIVVHALGAALLTYLQQTCGTVRDTLDAGLGEWLDPISGLDQQAEILRAAVSILVEQDQASNSPITSVLVKSWLQSQNLPDDHMREIVTLASNLVTPLLDTIELSDSRVHSSPRLRAIYALRQIPRTNNSALVTIASRSCCWLRIVSRGVDPQRDADSKHEQQRSDRFIRRIGRDHSGPIKVVGIDLVLVDQSNSSLPASVPQIIEGFPLADVVPVFETAATCLAIADSNAAWNGLKWLCLLNQRDYERTAESLRKSSRAVRQRAPEQGIHTDLPSRVAALLLWLTGDANDDALAASIDPISLHLWTYEKDYLPHPDSSFFFPLERRHATMTLNNSALRLGYRIQRVGELLLDPEFRPPETFIAELSESANRIDVSKLNRKAGRTVDDHHFHELAPALARCNPSLLACLIRRKLQNMNTCSAESRYWSAIHATDHLILARDTESRAARSLRWRSKENDPDTEDIAAAELMALEASNLDTLRQFDSLIEGSLGFFPIRFSSMLRLPEPKDIDALVARHSDSSTKQQYDLLLLLSILPVKLNDRAWTWIEAAAQRCESQRLVFKILTRAAPKRFGQRLRADCWSWGPDHDDWQNHYGTDALIEATYDLPFGRIVSKLAPWRLLEAARRRGSCPVDVRLAAKLFGRILMSDSVDLPLLEADLSVDRAEREISHLRIQLHRGRTSVKILCFG
ncbi:MAG: hypothetical protein OXQ31_09450 [Spirochaetaceae bacterium]|nr:hypothetical protein [Spirochaetaceae bacterium]